MEADDPANLRLYDSGRPCVAIATADMIQIDSCQSCGDHTVCDVENNGCLTKECYAVPAVTNGIFHGNMQQRGSKRKLVCNEWYKPEPEINQIECQPDGSWGTVPLCVPAVECPSPPALAHAVAGAITGDIIPGTEVTYSCLDGYSAPSDRNNFLQSCLTDGTWSAAGFECLKECATPPIVDNSEAGAITGDAHPGAEVTYTCLAGYDAPAARNDFLLTCLADGSWSTVGFECLKDCSDPTAMGYASLDVGETLHGTVRYYTCWNHYTTTTGSNTISTTCTSTGQWTTPSLGCLRDCGNPTAVSHASVSGGNNYEGSDRLYTCDAKYYVKKGGTVTTATTESVTCQTYGSWNIGFECVLSCPSSIPLISGSPYLADNKITASSEYSNNYKPYYGRLVGDKAWASETNNPNEYIQFDFSSPRVITSMTIQGSQGYKAEDEWVTSFHLLYGSSSCGSFTTVTDSSGNYKTFPGNTDRSSLRTNTFEAPLLAQCVRINPRSWDGWITMRVEMYGC